jgi:S1-C subfamily serine protease
MKKILLNVLRILWKVISFATPYVAILCVFLFFVNVENRVLNGQRALEAQLSEVALNQANNYSETIQIEQALLLSQSDVYKQINKIKADEFNSNTAIVEGVLRVVKDFSYILQKPSYEYLKSITVRIEARDILAEYLPKGQKGWSGTGCIVAVSKDFTYILTNRHIMEQYGDGTHTYYVKDGENKYTIEAIKISENPDVDLAFIRVKGHINGKQAVVGFADVQPQDMVFSVGMNLGRPFFYSEGAVAGFDPNSSDELVIGLPIGPGNSGSGVINKDGKLVGVEYAGAVIDQEGIKEMDITHALCVPIKAIRLFLAGYIKV